MTLNEIIERLEKAEDFDREADREIGRLLLGWTVTEAYIETDERDVYPNHPGALYPTFTESLDTAIALTEKVLPGWAWKVGTCCVSDDAWVTPDFNSPIHGERLKREFPDLKAGSAFDAGFDIDLRPSGRPAIALCIAVLTALKAKQMGVGE